MARGEWRWGRCLSRSSATSRKSNLSSFFFCRGKKRNVQRQVAGDRPDRMDERQLGGIDLLLQGRIVHESAHAEVRQQQTVEILTGQIWNAATKHHACAA